MVVCTGGMPSRSSVNRWNSEVKAAALIAHRLVAHMLPTLHALDTRRRAAAFDRAGYKLVEVRIDLEPSQMH